ncbi:2-oxo acid dehydrogenase subunit E2 [Candidatus Woesearchaeota archaeon]|nr:MAG: 2-oxo acid dehydrogenase subunit E2 [Candidatus Woesearchaeota archaeon]
MAFEFRLPDLGEGIAEGTIVKWLVKEGDLVEEHQEILELETDKALVRVPSPKTGILQKKNAKEGDTVKVGETLCTIADKGERIEGLRAKSEKEIKKEKRERASAKRASESSTVMGVLEEAPEEEMGGAEVKALPKVRKLAKDMGVDITLIKGTGPQGRITEDDVRAASGKKEKEGKGPSIGFDSFGRVLRVQMRGIRKTIAQRMIQSQRGTPHVTHMDYADVTKLWDIRQKEKEKAQERGVKLTLLPFIVKAVCLALKEFPYVNSSLDDNTQEIILKQYYNIGIAVDTPHGLMVPVVKKANEKTILDIAKDIWKRAQLARSREIKPEDMRGGTFTITNVGSIGGIFSTPIINPPECAILAIGRMQDVAVPGKSGFSTRKMLPLSLSFDHRIIDGALAAKFVNEIKAHLSDPDTLLIGY